MNIMIDNIYESREYRLREGSTFLMGVNQITFTCVPWNRLICWK